MLLYFRNDLQNELTEFEYGTRDYITVWYKCGISQI